MMKQVRDKNVTRFGVKWYKQPDYLVQSVQISLFYTFGVKGVSHFGSATGSARGVNLGEVSLAGHLRTVQGEGTLTINSASTNWVR